MKFCRDINYNDFGITEESGWKVTSDWNKLRKVFKRIEIAIPILLFISSFIFVRIFEIKFEIIESLICVVIAVLIFLFVLTPLHELLHLIPVAGLKFDDKCYIVFGKGTVSAFYSREKTRKQELISLIMPFIILGIILALIVVSLSGIYQFCAVIVLLMHVYGSYRDIYMFFYFIKNFPANTIFYGNRYKIN